MEATSKSDPSQEASQFILDPVVMAVLRFQPSVEQLALRLRDLVAQAAWEGQAQRVESLLNRWGGANAAWAIAGRSSDFGGQSSLDLSVKACNYHVTHVLMKHMPSQLEDELVDVLNEHNPVTGHSLLYAAVRYSSRRTAFVVQELIRRRADVNGRGSCRPTSEAALVHCVRRADISLIESLLEHRALVNIVGEDGKTLLQTAVARGDALILSCLLNTEGCDVNMLDRYQRSALASALGKSHHPVLVQILLDAKCSAVHLDCDGMQPLAHAIGLQDQRIYQSLLLRRADPNAIAVPARDKQTRLLHFAATRRDEVMVKCLLNAEADPNLKAKHDRTVLGLTIGLQLSEELLGKVGLIMANRFVEMCHPFYCLTICFQIFQGLATVSKDCELDLREAGGSQCPFRPARRRNALAHGRVDREGGHGEALAVCKSRSRNWQFGRWQIGKFQKNPIDQNGPKYANIYQKMCRIF